MKHYVGLDVSQQETAVCVVEKRKIVKLLPDRAITTVSTFLAQHPEINTISRDRGGGYRQAATKALPHAVKVRQD